MNKERWQQIEPIYFAALELGAAERTAYLEAACAGDADLRREVEALLRSEEEAGGFLEKPALAEPEFASLQGEEKTQLLPMPQPKQRISQYKLLAPLGKGGMGEVHLALDTRLQRKAALKLLPAQFTHDAERVRRFAQEARAASALNHPNILTIYEIGQATIENGSVHYIATEYVEGETLRQRMANVGQLPLSEALELGMQMTAALVAAHAAGIIHRDIKPENIMVRRDGLVKVLDFGLAKLLARDEGGGMRDESEKEPLLHPSSLIPHPSTALGLVMGTPRYMSPEQARGQKVDARSDLFSLGIVLYEMLAGTPPFAGASPMDTISAILTTEPKALRSWRHDVPVQLEQSIHRLLRKDREQRHVTAQELLTDLKACQVECNADARQTTALSAQQKPKPLWIGFTGLAMVLLLGSWWLWSRTQSARHPLRSEFSELFVDVERWTVPPSGWDIRGERLFIAQQPRVGYVTKLAADDFTMVFHLKLENAAGAAWALRIRDPDNYYLFHLSGAAGSQTATSYFSTYIVRDGKLGEAVSRIPVTKQLRAGGEYTVNITAKANEIIHLLSSADDPSTDPLGDPLGYFKDESNLYSSGGIGFRSVGAEQFSIDELYVRPLGLQ